jgi:predicted phosphodiesterase
VRVLVVSDIHSNLAALEAVLAEAGAWDALWCLGDIVGYGPQPNECIARLQTEGATCVPGNHDWAAINRIDTDGFNPDAKIAAEWTAGQLTPASRTFLEELPMTHMEADFTLAHGSPREPIWEYVFGTRVAAENFDYFTTRLCLVGHTHVPACFTSGPPVTGVYMEGGTRLDWGAQEGRFLLNPGGVGQPRDNDPRSAYMLLDTDRGEAGWHRVAYPIEVTQRLMREAGLPRRLIERLSYGW